MFVHLKRMVGICPYNPGKLQKAGYMECQQSLPYAIFTAQLAVELPSLSSGTHPSGDRMAASTAHGQQTAPKLRMQLEFSDQGTANSSSLQLNIPDH